MLTWVALCCREKRGRHSAKYTEEMEDKELLADEETGVEVRALAACGTYIIRA